MASISPKFIQAMLDDFIVRNHPNWLFCNPCAETTRQHPGIIGQWKMKHRLPDGKVAYKPVSAVGDSNPTQAMYTIGDLEFLANRSRSVEEAVKAIYAHITGSKPLSADPAIDSEAQTALVAELTRRLNDMERRMALTTATVEGKTNQLVDVAKKVAAGQPVNVPSKLEDLGANEAQIVADENYDSENGRWHTGPMTEADKTAFFQEYGEQPMLKKDGALDRRHLRRVISVQRLRAAQVPTQAAQ